MRPDDAFWAARIVSRFSDEAIRQVVAKARYTDPKATDYLTRTLIARRDKVIRAWITGVNPIVDVEVTGNQLVFGNAAVAAGAASAPESYTVQTARFDNTSGTASAIGDPITVREPRVPLPADALALRPGEYLQISITTAHASFPAWRTPAIVHLRRTTSGWDTVGLRRLP
jgi:hypothetical protein